MTTAQRQDQTRPEVHAHDLDATLLYRPFHLSRTLFSFIFALCYYPTLWMGKLGFREVLRVTPGQGQDSPAYILPSPPFA